MATEDGAKACCAWADRFHAPSAAELLEALEPPARDVFRAAREALCAARGVTESVAWEGAGWHWTLGYRHAGDGRLAWVYLIPDPKRPRAVIPLVCEMVDAIGVKRPKRFVKEGLIRARSIGGVCWPELPLRNAEECEEVVALAMRKHALLAEAAQPGARKR